MSRGVFSSKFFFRFSWKINNLVLKSAELINQQLRTNNKAVESRGISQTLKPITKGRERILQNHFEYKNLHKSEQLAEILLFICFFLFGGEGEGKSQRNLVQFNGAESLENANQPLKIQSNGRQMKTNCRLLAEIFQKLQHTAKNLQHWSWKPTRAAKNLKESPKHLDSIVKAWWKHLKVNPTGMTIHGRNDDDLISDRWTVVKQVKAVVVSAVNDETTATPPTPPHRYAHRATRLIRQLHSTFFFGVCVPPFHSWFGPVSSLGSTEAHR